MANIRVRPARVKSADHRIKARQLRGKIRVVHIGFNRLHIRRGEDLIRVARESGDGMTTRGEFAHDGSADITGGTNDCVFHKNLVE